MDELLHNKLQSYVSWAKDVHKQKERCSQHKEHYMNNQDFDALLPLISQEQLPLFTQKIERLSHMLEILHTTTQHFSDFHAEELLKPLVQTVSDIHLTHVGLKDTLSQQAKLLRELKTPSGAFEPITHEESLPVLGHLYELEAQKITALKGLVGNLNGHVKTVLGHLERVHKPLKRIYNDRRFQRDNRSLYESAYHIGLCSLFLLHQYGFEDAQTQAFVDHLEEKTAEEVVPLPSEVKIKE